ncbi:leader peptidase (prepilin peptidase)/N-methyltransferase [Virgibacillus natechei]|uniref:Leader peptidase (Prepilin peptidase)/N-methyltransferase n=1 Tax=Virgibacillus natechei TaxID=1216297 RepID=A0ABS4ID72_9BACI|nr:A24 family peptidase [Virgibacillus natechei]MBP1968890.1 leader peptidase (prepilin peptidase)/N-methyltransferase [Virgibacillus natechei]UZD11684.1 prepilin peptidase [Virgibacillus natechei]
MNTTIIILIFLLGLIFGSFYNVVGLRVPINQPFANERSICPYCQHQLAWYDNIPLLSFAILGGKCRHCKEKISYIYPLMELVTGILFTWSYVVIGLNLELVTALLLVSMLVIIIISDIKYMLIPNNVLLFFLPLFIIMRIFQPLDPWWSALLGAIIGFSIIAVIIIVSRGGMGAGDMKLFGVLGIVLGMEKVLLAFFLACMIGAIIGMALLLTRVIGRKQPVPFGPYIVVAALITYFYGESLINSYFNLLL